MIRAFARGNRAWGQDTKTGDRVLLRDLIRDGHSKLPVTERTYDARHPQRRIPEVYDPQILRRPAPRQGAGPGYMIHWPTGPWTELWRAYPALSISFYFDRVTVSG